MSIDISSAPPIVHVVVTFPLTKKPPFQEDVAPSATVGDVRIAAMNYFAVSDDSQYHYYLTHDGAKLDNSKPIGDIAGRAHSVKLNLVKELIQG
ncbi:MAG: hypothetical protein KGJ86_00900 [Chloroflexota bacterium]|nr:hypothetical protein [Chloroflexota bacterium]